MKYTFVLIALGTAFATQAFAQYDPTTANAKRQQRSSARVHVYAPDLPYELPGYQRNSNLNPDFQLGGGRWKTTSKAKHTRRHHSASHN
jgi:hypothetical protein